MTYENRADIPVRYTWNLTDIYAADKDFYADIESVESQISQIAKFKGNLNTDQTILECYKFLTSLNKPLTKAACYASLKTSEDNKNTDYQAMEEAVTRVFFKLDEACSFFEPELTALPAERLNAMLNDKKFEDYTVSLRRIIASKAHVLSAEEEEIMTGAGDVARYFHETFTRLNSGDLEFGTIETEGKTIPLTHGTYSMFLNNPDQNVRREAFEKMYAAFKKYINTICGLYNGSVKYDCFTAKTRKFDSALQKALFYEEVDKKVYTNLIDSINANLEPLHDYMALRKKVLGLETLNMYDLFIPMFKNTGLALEFDDAFKLVKEGLAPLGADYQQLLQTAYDNRWMDVYENKGKTTGAYSLGVTGVHPFVLLNYQKTTHDVFTIAHELGHSMHSYFSGKNQPFEKESYTIFVAEVASTTNEVLLLKYLLAKEKDQNVRKYLLSYFLDMIRTTFYRQAMFAEFEGISHNMVEKGLPFNYETLSKEYYALNKKYYGDAICHNEEIRYEWARIPHFYRGFYVYKYATGITCAVNIANKILKEGAPAVENYKKFLSTGCSMDPVSELQIAGADLTTTEPFRVIAEEFKSTLAQLKELTK